MDYAYFTTGWLPHQCFELSPGPATSNILGPSYYRPHPSAERSRDYISDSFTPYESLVKREQQEATSGVLSQNFKHDLTSIPGQQCNSLPQSPVDLSPLASSFASITTISGKILQPISPHLTYHESRSRSSSAEQEVLSPKRCRRKAQNRAAQRAFRERKEIRIKALEAELKRLQSQSASILGENDRLRQELAKVTTGSEGLNIASGFSRDGACSFDDPQCVHDHNQNGLTGSPHPSAADIDAEFDLLESSSDGNG